MDALLVNDHAELDGVMDKLLAALDEGDVEESFARLDLFWARLAVHIRAENLHLFPTILRELTRSQRNHSDDAPSLDEARAAIARLRDDHDFFMRELASAIRTMRELRVASGNQTSSGQPQEVRRRVAAVRSRLETHNKLEEEQVYRWTDTLLDSSAQARLAARLRSEIENLPPRFTDAAQAS
jgi:hypothetical protein